MEREDDLKMKRQVIEIEGGRKLYSYSFDREDCEGSEGGEDRPIDDRPKDREDAAE